MLGVSVGGWMHVSRHEEVVPRLIYNVIATYSRKLEMSCEGRMKFDVILHLEMYPDRGALVLPFRCSKRVNERRLKNVDRRLMCMDVATSAQAK